MRKILLASAMVAAMVAPTLPAQAGHNPGGAVTNHFTFTTDVPCLVVCSYWIDNGFTPCESPFPPGSYEDKVTKPAPTPPAGKVGLMTFEIWPTFDWDSFICSNDASRTELASGANVVGQPCDGILGPNDLSGTGCYEDPSIPTNAGRTYILRGYNWQDGPVDCIASYHFLSI